SGKPATVEDVIKILKNNIRSDSKISVKDIEEERAHFYYDTKTAKAKLGFEPKISLEEGIARLLH
ncbi:MAG TPA: hypothetical protein VNX68_14330, partial [Nitrosopumilaceae archaeon]|nr:hypothetical protein [Nitrosopumilaceae archaeon]